MIRSMTGFARREHQAPWGNLICELRTVNHRYLEMSLRLPEELKSIDGDIRQAIAGALRRGKVDANLYLKAGSSSSRTLELDIPLTEQVIERLGQIQSRLPAPVPVSAVDIMRWPGVIRDAETDASPILAAATALIQQALQDLNEMRSREGARIRELILQRCSALRTSVESVKARLPEVSQRLRSRILDRIAQLGIAPDGERLEQELVLYAHKMDVDEELDRLISHLHEVEATLDSAEPAGRRLDFLMQELNREANTLSSKSQDAETTKAAVDMKVSIEQMREQVQNIE